VTAVGDERYSSVLAAELAEPTLARFVRYAAVDTRSDPHSDRVPSTPGQLELLRQLVDELHALGVEDAELLDRGYVVARVPGNREAEPLGLIAHVDTYPGVSGAGVRPQVHRSWDGSPIRLGGDPPQILDPAAMPELAGRVGDDIVTSDGTTLLGADDKAGVAEIVTAVEHLLAHPELPRPDLVLGFTTDEEIARGVSHFDVEGFGARFAFTLDGSCAGEIQDETFCASQVVVRIVGVSTHTGTAKGVFVNALKLAARFLDALPPDRLSPETTEDRDGFVHPERLEGTASAATITFIVRSFDPEELRSLEGVLERVAAAIGESEPRATVTLERKDQYTNMRPYLDRHPALLDAAREAIRAVGLDPVGTAIRGGTDGARLTELGLPTPNLFTGGHEFHGEREWLCLQEMGAATATIVELARTWVERS
jgi:tripeptide aminopeptidase